MRKHSKKQNIKGTPQFEENPSSKRLQPDHARKRSALACLLNTEERGGFLVTKNGPSIPSIEARDSPSLFLRGRLGVELGEELQGCTGVQNVTKRRNLMEVTKNSVRDLRKKEIGQSCRRG